MSCDLFETVVLPQLPQRGVPEPDDVVGWRAARHRAECADCTARALRFESALVALNLGADLPGLAATAWPRVESAAASEAAQPGPDSARAKRREEVEDERLDWRLAARAALIGVAVAAPLLGLEYMRIESDGFGFLARIPDHLEDIVRFRVDDTMLRILFLAGWGLAAGIVRLFMARLFCQSGQCLA